MKVALCFIISYEHIVNKEAIWREWIEPNKDIINVYFYYKDFKKIKSEWIVKHTIPPNHIYETSYYHVIPAYLSILNFALTHDDKNQWFCMLTDSCCPIISPKKFRYLFYNYYNRTILSWKRAWWNVDIHKRANLALIPEEMRLANDPWFVMKRENILQIIHFANTQQKLTQLICSGGLANESLFAIIMNVYKQLNKNEVISSVSHITDWNRMASATSPHLFKDANEKDLKFIDTELEKNKYVMFIRKMSPEFPDDVLRRYIYEKNKKQDDALVIKTPPLFMYLKIKYYMYFVGLSGLSIILLYIAFCHFT